MRLLAFAPTDCACVLRIGPKGTAAIGEALKVNPVLNSLDVGCNGLTEEAALGIVRVEMQRNKLTSLGLASCKIGASGAAEIAEFLTVNKVLTTLNLSSNALCGVQYGRGTYTGVGVTAIAEALKVNKVLTQLDLYNNG